ncbi:hypothetical protein BCR43DRAFT_501536 [Syncephalastrum racemosum]|uniref:Uncharacterized protein n=1 Tax=Syncephalastrum racemosum TaxID=13706 RepID=A0A1X2HVU3_SYNRA|nr:hypothetical protein BCR43DRAFT_501536 [Syncephalastrum racemosum]
MYRWGGFAGTGDKPGNRTLHTTTLMPEKRILMFGGADVDSLTPITRDPVYVITVNDDNPDSPKFTFTQRALPKDGAVIVYQRWGHSSVLVTDKQNNSYVFILLGRGSDNKPQSDFHILSTTNFTWMGPKFSVASPEMNDNSNGLSGGAIAGVVVGIVVGVAVIAGLIAFCCVRKRRQQYSAANQNFPAYNSAGTQASQPPPSYTGGYAGDASVAASKPDAPTSATGRIAMTPVVKPDGA